MTRRTAVTAALIACTLALTGCTTGGSPTALVTNSVPLPTASPSASAVVGAVTRTMTVDGVPLTITVGPVTVDGSLAQVLIRAVPVDPSATPAGTIATTFKALRSSVDTAAATVRTYPLSEYRTSPSEDFRTTQTGQDVQVDLSADVLFAYDKADLTAKADATLRKVGQQVVASGAGTLSIVGHTDDQGSASYNQSLSERRAQAVAQRLKSLVDLSGVTVSAKGVGEADPAVEGTSASARALNRRVELEYTATKTPDSTSVPTTLPTTAGQSGTATDGVVVKDKWNTPTTTWKVQLTSLQRKAGYLIGQFAVTLESGAESATVTILGSGSFDSRGSLAYPLAYSASRLSLLTSDTRTYPAQYVPKQAAKGDATVYRPLGDTIIGLVPRGVVRTVTVVWPDVAGDELTVDAAPPRWLIAIAKKGYNVDRFIDDQPSFRLTGAQVTG